MRSSRCFLATASVSVALACAACGSATGVNVIRDWAKALTAGDLAKAASYFALPVIVENGTPPLRLTSRAEVRQFNEMLPCGARLVATAHHGAYTFATFRLTNRVGGDCGAGTGALAATAFLIRNGKIAQWRRLANPGRGQQPPSAPTPTAPGQRPTV